MSVEIVVGCPVLYRAWVLPRWFDHVEIACKRAGLIPAFCFVGDSKGDPKTWDVIYDRTKGYELLAESIDEVRRFDIRDWDKERFARMAFLRNLQLQRVKAADPDLFLSLDSDILLHPDALSNMIETQQARFDVVGGYCHMTPMGRHHPSFANLVTPDRMYRWKVESPGVFPVDIVMAIVLQDRRAYGVPWAPAREGEDIGHSNNLRAAQLKLGADARVVNKHVMNQHMLEVVDSRCGF